MRPFMGICVAVLLYSAAEAQPLYTLQDMINNATRQCIAQRPGQPDAPRFCSCLVTHWVGLWDDNDRDIWIRTGIATRHMVEMEQVAATDCGGG